MDRRGFLKAAGIGAISIWAGTAISTNAEEKQKNSENHAEINKKKGKFNVLMIPVDDLRPALGCYGVKEVISPNIDKIAAKGMVFKRAYTMISICSPSRTSLLTGLRPDTTKVYDLNTHFRKAVPDVVTLPQYFRLNGYVSVGMGKVYHSEELNDTQSWDKWIKEGKDHKWLDENTQKMRKKLEKEAKTKNLNENQARWYSQGTATECLDVADDAYGDGKVTNCAIKELQQFAKSGQRFFMAVGYRKPHLPFIAPKKYWDLYKESDIKTAVNPFIPKGLPSGAVDEFPGEFQQYWDARQFSEKLIAEGKKDWPQDYSRKLIHGYYACVSYIDAQVGKLMQTLDETGLIDNTVICLWGDHGWHLGENGTWGKHTNMEWGTRSPLILYVPGVKHSGSTDRLVEFVDVYPTLAEACGLQKPDTEGLSVMPLLENPKRKLKEAALSQYLRKINGISCIGYSIRTELWRYTEWRRKGTASVIAKEFYDHRINDDENKNLVNDDKYKPIVGYLATKLNALIKL